MAGLAQTATVTTTVARTNYTNNQLQAARDVNRIEYEQRVQALGAELTQVQLQRQQAALQAQQQSQANQRSYTQGMYEVLKQRVASQEQAFAGKEQGMQIQAENAAQGTQQYRELLNAALQLEAQQSKAQQEIAQASMFTDPLSITNTNNTADQLRGQVQAFMQNRMMNNQAIGDDQLQTEYTGALAEVLRRLGINDSQLTTNMADQNQANINTQYSQNANQIAQQSALNDRAYSQAESGLNNARNAEYQRYRSDDKNLVRLNSAQQQSQQRSQMSMSGYTYRDGAWYQNQQTQPSLMSSQQALSAPTQGNISYSQPLSTQGLYTPPQQQANQRLYIGSGSTAREELLKADPNAVIIMPEDKKKNA